VKIKRVVIRKKKEKISIISAVPYLKRAAEKLRRDPSWPDLISEEYPEDIGNKGTSPTRH